DADGFCAIELFSWDATVLPSPQVYLGSSLATLSPVPNLEADSGQTGVFHFAVTSGTTYQIGVFGIEASFYLFLMVYTPPPNDSFASRSVLTGTNVWVNVSNFGATVEPGEPGDSSGHSGWWGWTSSVEG